MLNERRKFRRFDVSLDVAFKISKTSKESFTGVTRNFSRRGFCFESDAFAFALESPVELRVKLPDQDAFIPVSGNVAWKERVNDKCWIGIEMTEMDKEVKSQILDYAYDQWVEGNRNTKSDARV